MEYFCLPSSFAMQWNKYSILPFGGEKEPFVLGGGKKPAPPAPEALGGSVELLVSHTISPSERMKQQLPFLCGLLLCSTKVTESNPVSLL